MEKFSVLMSVYMNDSPECLFLALQSILIEQTLIPAEVVLVKDGPITEELNNVINSFKKDFNNVIKVIELEENQGLGMALNIGMQYCSYELIARMDSDDICDKRRFEKQIKFFNQHPNIDVLGGSIAEFYDNPTDIVAYRKLPSNILGIRNMMKHRNPVNHVSVMFKKTAVQYAGGYKHLAYLEDYYLWVRMLKANCIIENMDDVLVYVRTGREMYKRRGNKQYIRGWYYLQVKMREIKLINRFDIVINMISIIVFIYMPAEIKEFIYKKFLRK